MFIVFLKFSDNKANAGDFMEAHNAWIKQGFADKKFLLVGSIEINLGGSIIAHNESLQELEERVNKDPFVAENVVTAEIVDISPKMTDERLSFLLENT